MASLLAVGVLVAPRALGQSSSLPVVPGAFGFGMQTRAAYGGTSNPTIYRVTSLADSGVGTLRQALEASGPRVVIFEVSGYINLLSPITILNPYLTVAGQTAPSPGITLRYYGIESQTHDVLLQHVRIRPGWTGANCNSALDTWTGTYNNVYDHMSISWQQDEGYAWQAHDSTLWRSITAEALFYPSGSAGCGGGGGNYGHGALISDYSQNIAILQSLFAHNSLRNPEVASNTTSYIANNLIYDFNEPFVMADPNGKGGDNTLASLIGNYFKRGPGTPTSDVITGFRYLTAGSQFYPFDNIKDDNGIPLADFVVINGDGVDPTVGFEPVTPPSGFIPLSGSATYAFVLANAGARPLDRDGVDKRIVSEVINCTGNFIVTQADVGGWPTLAQNTHALTTPANPHRVTPSGYTNLEEWLHGYAAGVESGMSQTPPSAPQGLSVR